MPMELEAHPFAGDTFMSGEFKRIIKDFGIKTIFETGTYLGITAAHLATFGVNIETVELNKRYFGPARQNLAKFKNVNIHLGNSPVVMSQRIQHIQKPVLFFLDAHWGAQWPILAELGVIARHRLTTSCIAIHDFKVPGKTFGFDSLKKVPLDWKYVAAHINKIYGRGKYKLYYNEEAAGAKRGVAYITPVLV